MLAITYSTKKEIMVAKWGTLKKYLKKQNNFIIQGGKFFQLLFEMCFCRIFLLFVASRRIFFLDHPVFGDTLINILHNIPSSQPSYIKIYFAPTRIKICFDERSILMEQINLSTKLYCQFFVQTCNSLFCRKTLFVQKPWS